MSGMSFFDPNKGDMNTATMAGLFKSLATSDGLVVGVDASVGRNLTVTGNALVTGTLGVTGAVTFGGAAQAGPAQVYNNVTTSLTVNDLPIAAATLTGGWLQVYFNYTGATSGSTASTWTLPSVAAVVAAMTSAGFIPIAGASYLIDFYNNQGTGTRTFTLTADTGATWTLAGTAHTIANGTMRRYLVTLTSLTAGTMQSLGVYTPTAVP